MKIVKSILFSLCFLSIFQLSAQTKIGVNFYPAFSFPIYQNGGSAEEEAEQKEFLDPVLTYSGGVELRIPMAKQLDFSIGLIYATVGHQFDYDKATDFFFYGNKPNFPKQTKTIYQYFELPVGVTKYFGTNPTPCFSVSVNSGLRYALSTWQINTFEKELEGENNKSNLGKSESQRNFTYPLALSFNFYIPVSSKILWEIGPAITYQLPGTIKEGDALLNFFQAGITTSVLFQ